ARAALDFKGAEDPEASASRCAARAALDFKGAEDPEASASRCAARAAFDRKSATALATGTLTSNSNLCELPDPGTAPNW
ncbi:MAG: hypothetical protein ACN6O4_15680, partial [Pseudomonas sp.]